MSPIDLNSMLKWLQKLNWISLDLYTAGRRRQRKMVMSTLRRARKVNSNNERVVDHTTNSDQTEEPFKQLIDNSKAQAQDASDNGNPASLYGLQNVESPAEQAQTFLRNRIFSSDDSMKLSIILLRAMRCFAESRESMYPPEKV